MPVCHCVTMPMLEFTNGLSTSVLKISIFPEPIDVLKMLSQFPPSNDFLAVLANQCLLFFYQRQNIAEIYAQQFFLNTAVSCENLLLLITIIFFFGTLHLCIKIHRSDCNRSVHFLGY